MQVQIGLEAGQSRPDRCGVGRQVADSAEHHEPCLHAGSQSEVGQPGARGGDMRQLPQFGERNHVVGMVEGRCLKPDFGDQRVGVDPALAKQGR